MAQVTETDDEPVLVGRARRGDRDAFGRLVERHRRRAYAQALALVGSREDALDLSQEAFVRAYRARHTLDPERPFYAWLYQILRRLCFNFLRDARTRRRLMDEEGRLWLIERARAPLRRTRAVGAPAPRSVFQRGDAMIVTPSASVPNHRVARSVGLVYGSTVRARHVGKDILAGLKNLIGGEVQEYTKLLAESREQAVDRMIASATSRGANAVVNVRFTTSYIMANASEILVYGDAVVLEPATGA